jgi:hypothetical protein
MTMKTIDSKLRTIAPRHRRRSATEALAEQSQRAARCALALAASALAACAPSTHVIVGEVHPPTTPDQVKVYSHPPANFQEIAILDASSKSAFGPGGQKSVDKVIERLKLEAAKLGANGLILEGFSDADHSAFSRKPATAKPFTFRPPANAGCRCRQSRSASRDG